MNSNHLVKDRFATPRFFKLFEEKKFFVYVSFASLSLLDGVSYEVECQLRAYGCDVLRSAGIMLHLPVITITTAQCLLHQFYFVKSLKKYDIKDMLLGAMFIATKLEENHSEARYHKRSFSPLRLFLICVAFF